MTEGYCTSVHIDLLWVEFQFAHAVHVHRSESFIDLAAMSRAGHYFFTFHAYLE